MGRSSFSVEGAGVLTAVVCVADVVDENDNRGGGFLDEAVDRALA